MSRSWPRSSSAPRARGAGIHALLTPDLYYDPRDSELVDGRRALLKGQRLPDRLRKDEYQIQQVKDFIEEVGVRLELAGDAIDDEVKRLVEQIFEKYFLARDIVTMNRPSCYAHHVESRLGEVPRARAVGPRL
ncbi:hypothetical protein B2J93_1917 [Marssonina coronariae]|uniref:Uncharacterized protein n=1 Tax=Diplocarpon coronariae TaxID=2795749 RepID=A0A218YVC0_9HELO|nr:hypothetical protein B2J93_1917 [Marssonina coronariae]